jgi:hypothetical protein
MHAIKPKTDCTFYYVLLRSEFHVVMSTTFSAQMDYPEKLVTLGTQDSGRRQTKQKHTTIFKQTQIM